MQTQLERERVRVRFRHAFAPRTGTLRTLGAALLVAGLSSWAAAQTAIPGQP